MAGAYSMKGDNFPLGDACWDWGNLQQQSEMLLFTVLFKCSAYITEVGIVFVRCCLERASVVAARTWSATWWVAFIVPSLPCEPIDPLVALHSRVSRHPPRTWIPHARMPGGPALCGCFTPRVRYQGGFLLGWERRLAICVSGHCGKGEKSGSLLHIFECGLYG